MLHLRLIVPVHLAQTIFDHLAAHRGVAHVVDIGEVKAQPVGRLLLCDVARESANEVIEWLQRHEVHHLGAISVHTVETVVSDAAERAENAAPGHAAADALVWEELEARVRSESVVTGSFLVLIGIAAVIAGVGILLDAPILIVGAMVVGPEYGPLAAICVAAKRRRARSAGAAASLALGLVVAAGAALAATLIFRWTGLGPGSYDLSDRELTSFISHPDGMAAVVAVLAGIVGMLSLTEARSGVLIGVLVSVTTIPAVANVGVATAYGEWAEVGGATMQLGINLAGLILAGIATLAVQNRLTAHLPDRS